MTTPAAPQAAAMLDAALAMAQGGNLAGATITVDALLASWPDHAGGLALRGALRNHAGDSRGALGDFDRALALGANDPPLLNNRAAALIVLGRFAEARDDCTAALAQRPDYLAALCNRAAAALSLGDPAAALADADAALRLDPAVVLARLMRGQALAALDQTQPALDSFDAVLAAQPRHAVAWIQRSAMLFKLLRFEEALTSADRALEIAPSPEAHMRRGMALIQLRRLGKAVAAFDAALALDPQAYDAHISRGVALNTLARYAEGLESFDRAIAVDPAQPLGYFRRAQAKLRLGDYDGGWADHERRWETEVFTGASSGYVVPRLRDRLDPRLTRADLAGKRVLLLAEQGVGDQIMFASMIPDLAADAASVTLACDPRLHGLIAASMPDVALLTAPPADAGGFDHVVALGSLGRLYRPDGQAFPGAPYLAPRPALIEAWRERLGVWRGRGPAPLRVGLSWSGGLRGTDAPTRSMALNDLGPLITLEGTEFFSLQYGEAAAQAAAANASLLSPIRTFPPQDIDDFEQLAALVLALDLVVSVQTALIHLCGAIGAPCLVMVPFMAEWRYGARGETMPWYGSVRLYRQKAPDAWGPVIEAVTDAAAAAVAARSSAPARTV